MPMRALTLRPAASGLPRTLCGVTCAVGHSSVDGSGPVLNVMFSYRQGCVSAAAQVPHAVEIS